MRVSITFQDLLEANKALKAISKKESPFRTAYRISKLAKKVESETKAFHSQRMEIFKNMGILDEKTKMYNIPEERQPEFSKTMQELLEKNVTFEFHPIEADMIKGSILTPDQINAVFVFIEGDLE